MSALAQRLSWSTGLGLGITLGPRGAAVQDEASAGLAVGEGVGVSPGRRLFCREQGAVLCSGL